MGKSFESRFLQRQSEGQFPNAKSLKLPLDLNMPNTCIPCAIPCTNEAPITGSVPPYELSKLPGCKGNTNICGSLKVLDENHGLANISHTDPRGTPKQFLVFDQTCNQTTLILSSMIGTPNPPLNYLNPKKVTGYYNESGCEFENRSTRLISGPNLTELDDLNVLTEMHEDSEDINALLSSDDEDNFIEDGEETSTGRCPSTYKSQLRVNKKVDHDDMDEVASSLGPSKRQKLSDVSYEGPSITYTSSYPKPKGSLDYEDDAESSCLGDPPKMYDDMCLISGSKRERKEKIRETVSVLRTILPNGNEKDPVAVLNEAINYLKTLRFKAKSLGISGL